MGRCLIVGVLNCTPDSFSAGGQYASAEAAIEAGANDIASDAEQHLVTCAPEDFNAVRDALESRFGPADAARLTWRPKTTSEIGEETAATLFKLLETLEDSDDVQNVYANFDVTEDVMARLGA